MVQSILVGVLIVGVLGAGVAAWWIDNHGASEKIDESEKEIKKYENEPKTAQKDSTNIKKSSNKNGKRYNSKRKAKKA